jgi:hypothetical protein
VLLKLLGSNPVQGSGCRTSFRDVSHFLKPFRTTFPMLFIQQSIANKAKTCALLRPQFVHYLYVTSITTFAKINVCFVLKITSQHVRTRKHFTYGIIDHQSLKC